MQAFHEVRMRFPPPQPVQEEGRRPRILAGEVKELVGGQGDAVHQAGDQRRADVGRGERGTERAPLAVHRYHRGAEAGEDDGVHEVVRVRPRQVGEK